MTGTTNGPTSDDRPGRSPDEVVARLRSDLSRRDRLGYVALLLLGVSVAGLVATLWATEPALPLRTHLAFAGIVTIAIAWSAVSAYVLSRRRPLYAADRVLATGLAVIAASSVAVVTTVLAATRGGGLVAVTAAVVGVSLAAVATSWHVRARRARRALLARREALDPAV